MKALLNRLSLKHQLILFILTPALMGVLLTSGYMVQQRVQDLRESLAQQGQLLANNIAKIAEYPLISGQLSELQSVQQSALNNRRVANVWVLDHHGNVVIGKPPEKGAASHLLFHANVWRSQVGSDTFEFFNPESESANNSTANNSKAATQPTSQSQRLGRIGVLMSQTEFSTSLNEVFISAGLLLAVLLASIFLLGHYFTRAINTPLRQMGDRLQGIRQGDYGRPLALQAPKDIQSLGEDINHLSQALEQAHQKTQQQIKDITSAREAADRANASKSEFLALISHELRTPLNAAYGMLQLLEDTQMGTLQQRYLTVASQSAQHLQVLINDLLDLSKLEFNRLSITREPFDLQQLVEQIVEVYQPLAEEKQLALNHQMEWGTLPPGSMLLSDPVRLRQIISNLLSNAIKFTEQGQILLSMTLAPHGDGQQLKLSVQDTSTGIAEQDMEKIFQLFEQVEAISDRNHEGIGLGLTVTKRLTELLGGSIEVNSQPGLGTKFTVTLPLDCADPQALEQPNPPSANKPLESAHVLIVEDNMNNLMVMKQMLRHINIQADAVTQGSEAIELCRRHHYDLVLLDCFMPKMDGFSVARTIRSLDQDQQRYTPIIAVTASHRDSTREQCFEAGMDGVIEKPYSKFQIYEMVRQSKYLQHKMQNLQRTTPA